MEHPAVEYVGGIQAAAERLLANVAAEDIVITMSAGDGNQVGQLLLAGLRLREGKA
jgi:UDP-N-acetylmuramate-alanine ligase